jgi:hypothetical protein
MNRTYWFLFVNATIKSGKCRLHVAIPSRPMHSSFSFGKVLLTGIPTRSESRKGVPACPPPTTAEFNLWPFLSHRRISSAISRSRYPLQSNWQIDKNRNPLIDRSTFDVFIMRKLWPRNYSMKVENATKVEIGIFQFKVPYSWYARLSL